MFTSAASGNDIDSDFFLKAEGAMSEYVIGTRGCVFPLPDHLSYEEAAATPCGGITAYYGLVEIGKVKAGDHVFVNGGSGGVGTWAIMVRSSASLPLRINHILNPLDPQIAKALGAHVTTTSSPSSHQLLTSLGADTLIDYTTTPDLPTHLSTLPYKFNLFFDASGQNPQLAQQAGRYLDGVYVDITALANVSGFGDMVLALGKMVVRSLKIRYKGYNIDEKLEVHKFLFRSFFPFLLILVNDLSLLLDHLLSRIRCPGSTTYVLPMSPLQPISRCLHLLSSLYLSF